MPSILPSRSFMPFAIVAMFLAILIDEAAAGAFTRGCAMRDLQVLMLIEEREDANAVSMEELMDAMFAMMHARVVCNEGRVTDALALYDSIRESIATSPTAAGRRKASRPVR